MNKLNNNGWGLGVFIAFIGVFFVAIIMIVYVSNKYNVGIEKINVGNTSEKVNTTFEQKYEEYEKQIKEKSILYQESNYPNILNDEVFYTSINNLDLSEKILKECTGYVEFKKSDNIYYYSPYIDCGTYKTNNYNPNLNK